MGARERVVHPSHRKDLDRRDVLGCEKLAIRYSLV
jgi:hypothetical protein